MTKFVNPLAHVTPPAPEVVTITVASKKVPFTPLGLDQIGVVVNRFPAMRAMITGERNLDGSQFSTDDNVELAVTIIGQAMAPGIDRNDAGFKAMQDSIRAMRPIERDLAVGQIMQASFPDTVVDAEVGNAPKAAVKKIPAARSKTTKKPATKARAAK